MSSKHLSIRIESDTLDRLDQQSRRAGQTRSELVKMLLEEGLRMEIHPGIVFRPGPVGRRPALANGPDVWEIVRAFSALPYKGEAAVQELAKEINLIPEQVRTAMRYYTDFEEEIDAWINRFEEEVNKAEVKWRREQEILSR